MIKSQIDISDAGYSSSIHSRRKSSIIIDVPNMMLNKDFSDKNMVALFNSTTRVQTKHKQSRSLIYGKCTERKKVKKLTGNFPELY